MPVVQEKWITSPLAVVHELLGKSSSDDQTGVTVKEFFDSKVSEKSLYQIPSLNHTPLHHLPDGCLVRYRAMVQDQFDPEFYFKIYHSQHKERHTETSHCGMYRDITEHPVDHELMFDHHGNVTGDRLTLYCVPIPGETQWTRDCYQSQSSFDPGSGDASESGRLKRPLSEDREESEEMDSGEGLAAKKSCDSRNALEAESAIGGEGYDMNFPLPGEEGAPAMVKVYSDFESFKVTSMVEFIGVLSVDPCLAGFTNCEETMVDAGDGESPAERRARSPPPSLIPRLHAITSHILTHSCPLLPPYLPSPITQAALPALCCDIFAARQLALDTLTGALLGDKVAAEYLLLHLFSSVYGRTDILALGKFSLNLTNCTTNALVESLNSVFKAILTKYHRLEMSLESMNKSQFSPKKDYQANRLSAGLLQLSHGTELLVDETCLSPGQLTEVGVKNLTALGNLIQWQKVTYDFQYHVSEFESNLPVLLISTGKSIIQTDCLVPMVTSSPGVHLPQLTAVQLDHIRKYLAITRMLDYKISDAIKKNLEEDFVTMRRGDSGMTADSFHHLLNVARLVCVSYGSSELTMEHWAHVKQLEKERNQRLSSS